MPSLFTPGKFTELVFYSEKYAEKMSEWYYDFDYRYFFRENIRQRTLEDFKVMRQDLAAGGVGLTVILDKVSREPVGLMTFQCTSNNSHVYRFGIMLEKGRQHKTHAIDAIIVLMDYFTHRCLAHKVFVEICDDDKHIHRICQLGGFTHEATLKEEILMDGKYHDVARYYLMADAFKGYYGNYLSDGTIAGPEVPKK